MDIFHNPGYLQSAWFAIPCLADALSGQKTVHFKFNEIAWDTEGIEDGCVIVFPNGEDILVDTSSMRIIESECTDRQQQMLALVGEELKSR